MSDGMDEKTQATLLARVESEMAEASRRGLRGRVAALRRVLEIVRTADRVRSAVLGSEALVGSICGFAGPGEAHGEVRGAALQLVRALVEFSEDQSLIETAAVREALQHALGSKGAECEAALELLEMQIRQGVDSPRATALLALLAPALSTAATTPQNQPLHPRLLAALQALLEKTPRQNPITLAPSALPHAIVARCVETAPKVDPGDERAAARARAVEEAREIARSLEKSVFAPPEAEGGAGEAVEGGRDRYGAVAASEGAVRELIAAWNEGNEDAARMVQLVFGDSVSEQEKRVRGAAVGKVVDWAQVKGLLEQAEEGEGGVEAAKRGLAVVEWCVGAGEGEEERREAAVCSEGVCAAIVTALNVASLRPPALQALLTCLAPGPSAEKRAHAACQVEGVVEALANAAAEEPAVGIILTSLLQGADDARFDRILGAAGALEAIARCEGALDALAGACAGSSARTEKVLGNTTVRSQIVASRAAAFVAAAAEASASAKASLGSDPAVLAMLLDTGAFHTLAAIATPEGRKDKEVLRRIVDVLLRNKTAPEGGREGGDGGGDGGGGEGKEDGGEGKGEDEDDNDDDKTQSPTQYSPLSDSLRPLYTMFVSAIEEDDGLVDGELGEGVWGVWGARIGAGGSDGEKALEVAAGLLGGEKRGERAKQAVGVDSFVGAVVGLEELGVHGVGVLGALLEADGESVVRGRFERVLEHCCGHAPLLHLLLPFLPAHATPPTVQTLARTMGGAEEEDLKLAASSALVAALQADVTDETTAESHATVARHCGALCPHPAALAAANALALIDADAVLGDDTLPSRLLRACLEEVDGGGEGSGGAREVVEACCVERRGRVVREAVHTLLATPASSSAKAFALVSSLSTPLPGAVWDHPEAAPRLLGPVIAAEDEAVAQAALDLLAAAIADQEAEVVFERVAEVEGAVDGLLQHVASPPCSAPALLVLQRLLAYGSVEGMGKRAAAARQGKHRSVVVDATAPEGPVEQRSSAFALLAALCEADEEWPEAAAAFPDTVAHTVRACREDPPEHAKQAVLALRHLLASATFREGLAATVGDVKAFIAEVRERVGDTEGEWDLEEEEEEEEEEVELTPFVPPEPEPAPAAEGGGGEEEEEEEVDEEDIEDDGIKYARVKAINVGANQRSGPTTVYRLDVERRPKSAAALGKKVKEELWRRYSDFEYLHKELLATAPAAASSLPPLPPGGLTKFFKKNKTSTVTKRTAAFSNIVRVIAANPELRNLEVVRAFCDPTFVAPKKKK